MQLAGPAAAARCLPQHAAARGRSSSGAAARPAAAAAALAGGSRRQRPQQRQHHRRLAAAAASPAAGAPPSLKPALELLLARADLSEEQAQAAMRAVLGGAAREQAAALLVLLRAKGETPAELAGLARAMLDDVTRVPLPPGPGAVDIVGTGGDGIGSVNISTGACVVAAAAGARVAKHGGRSVSSLCGAADVLEALGVAIELGPAGVASCVSACGLGFMYAPRYHPAMAALRPVRAALGVRTVANMLGPLLNPAGAAYSLVGVYSPSISGLMAEALRRLGTSHALVVHSAGLDELTPMAPADIVEVAAGVPGLKHYTLDPRDLGIPRCDVADLAGGDAALNASILRDVFGGGRGPVADALCLNAGVALAAANVAASPAEGVAMALEAQRAGAAGAVLDKWVAASQAAAAAEAAAAQASSQQLSTAAAA